MCGIFGIWNTREKPIDMYAFTNAVSSIRHRGPDDEGYLLANLRQGRAQTCIGPDSDPGLNLPGIESQHGQGYDFALGFRRLSILDLSLNGHQPMSSPDKRYWMVFNGEIYNYLELCSELTALGHKFTSTSDTEVLLTGYTHWGVDILPKLIGMFAFAVLDMHKRTLFLARDNFGIKPLYYTFNKSRFAFASEAKALMTLGDVSRKANPAAVYVYLRYGITDNSSMTMWDGIQHLPSAHYLEIDLDSSEPELNPKRYWDIDMAGRSKLSRADAAEQMRHLFMENIRLHLRSDVPVGAALSGGIDSSAIVMAMHQLQPEQEIHTFSYIADDDKLNEEAWMDMIINQARTIPHKTRIHQDNLVSDLDDFIYSLDEPFSSTSMYAQNCVFRLAQEAGIKVMLDGQGADESLGGYNYFYSLRLVSMLRRGHLLEASIFLRNNWQRPYFGGPWLVFRAGGWLLPERLHGLARKTIGEDLLPDWFNKNWFEKQGVDPPPVYKWDRSRDAFRKMLYQSVMETSLPMLLRYEDRNSMAYSIESRVPFLTSSFINFIFSLPEEHIIDIDGNSKSIFRQAMHGLVPAPILERRDKVGFSTPEQRWLNNLRPWVEQVLNSEAAHNVFALNLGKVTEEWQRISTGKKPFNFRVWRWLNLIHWAKRHAIEF